MQRSLVLPQRVKSQAAQHVFDTLFAREKYSFWLDGGASARRGMSFLGAASQTSTILEARANGTVYIARGDARFTVACDLLEVMRDELTRHGDRDAESDDFSGGWVGWFGYEWGAARNGIAVAVEPDDVVARFMFVDRLVAIDHQSGLCELRWLSSAAADDWADDIAARLHATVPGASTHGASVPGARATALGATVEAQGPPVWRHDDEQYVDLVRRCLEHIRAGDAYQLCLTTRVTCTSSADPLAVFRELREHSATHHGGYVRFDDTALVSATPERFLTINSDGTIASSPIKGTRPRDSDARRDAAFARELVTSEKERAENLMITDLVRNDFSRVCETSSVVVARLHDVESYPHVHQLVSTIEGRLASGRDAFDAIDACFPAGSMTGAPKLNAMALLRELEGAPRGAYAGAFGYLAVGGAADLAMTIRTIVCEAGVMTVGAGGGITALSEPYAERDEAKLKAAALMAAIARAGNSSPGFAR